MSLLEEHLQDNYGTQVLTLVIDGEEIEFTPEEAGLRFQTSNPARQAWDHGREGGFFQRAGTMISSLFNPTEIPLSEELYIDQSIVEALVEQTAERIDIAVIASAVEAGDTEIRVTAGSPGRSVDVIALTALFVDHLERGDFSAKILYQTIPTKPQPVDVNALYEQYYVPPKNAWLDITDERNLIVMPEQSGISFDVEAAQSALSDAAPGQVISITLYAVPAAIDAATLQSKLFVDELSTFTTYLNAGNRPRASNIKLAASIIDGVILLPGDEFSFNGVVGQRTTARGFQLAGAFLNGRLVDDVGGGVCQMSTTVYNAAVRANLKITDRSCHSLTVNYVPVGLDAAVNWGTTDLKFQNNTDYPIKIMAVQSGGSVTVTVIGTKVNDYTVSLESRELSRTPYEVKTVNNAGLAPGARNVTQTGYPGVSAESYRVVKDKNGNVISRELEAKSRYTKVDQIVEVGPGAAPGPEPGTAPPPEENPGEDPPLVEPPTEADPPPAEPPPAESNPGDI